MSTIRIIPRLDIKGPNLVKGIHLEGLRVLGKPEEFAHFYYKNGADELLYMDVVASLYDRNSLEEIVSRTAQDIFIPLTVAGGIRTLKDIKRVLRAGADKVSINTAAIKNPDFIQEAALKFGSSTIVVAIEAIKQPEGQYLAFTDNGREYTGVEVVEWASRVQDLGAGELIITSVDHEGTGMGFDQELIRQITREVKIPVVVHGGAGNKAHFAQTIKNCQVDGICAASIFHYEVLEKGVYQIEKAAEGNYDYVLNQRKTKNFETISIHELKAYLDQEGIEIRI